MVELDSCSHAITLMWLLGMVSAVQLIPGTAAKKVSWDGLSCL